MKIAFTVYGRPHPQERPRVFGRTFIATDPPKSRAAKKVIHMAALMARQSARISQGKGSFSVLLRFFGANPLADLDNLQKCAIDGMADVFWDNDRRIFHIEAWKHPAEKGKERTEIEVTEL